jgi:general secretion pathway protein G
MKLRIKSGSGEWRVASGKRSQRDTPTASRYPSPVTRHASGFTLVEMLLVLVILATLAAIVYPRVVGRSEQARVTSAQTQIASFTTALNAFEVDNGYFPKGKNGLLDLVTMPRDATSWHGPYLDKIPNDPWNNAYSYEYPGRHNPNGFDLSSPGPDGRPGDEDDIANWETKK